MQGEVKYLYKMRRRAGSAPHPLPRSADGAVGGGGGEAGELCPAWGILSRERGDLGLVSLAGHIRVWIWRVSTARHFGGSAWRVKWAHLFNRF